MDILIASWLDLDIISSHYRERSQNIIRSDAGVRYSGGLESDGVGGRQGVWIETITRRGRLDIEERGDGTGKVVIIHRSVEEPAKGHYLLV